MRTLVNELEELAKQFGDGHDGIPNKFVTDLLLRKLENSKSLWDEGSLPEDWWTLKEYDFQNMVRNLDKTGAGIVNWRQLATYIILLRSPLPTDQDIESFTKHHKNPLISLNDFTKAKFWFDKSEFSQDRDYSIPFPRLHSIKELLFIANRTFALPAAQQIEERVSTEDFVKVLTSARLVIQGNTVRKSDQAAAQNAKTFGDVLFMQSNLADPLSPKKKKKAAAV